MRKAPPDSFPIPLPILEKKTKSIDTNMIGPKPQWMLSEDTKPITNKRILNSKNYLNPRGWEEDSKTGIMKQSYKMNKVK